MTKTSGNPAIEETFYTRNDGTIIECLDSEGEFKFNLYCYEHGKKFIKGNCGCEICIDCKKDWFYYLKSCHSCLFYNYEQDSSVGYESEYCSLMPQVENLKNWPFVNGCSKKVRK